MQLSKEEYARKRIHVSSVQIENSVTRVTVRHQEACRVMSNSYTRSASGGLPSDVEQLHSWQNFQNFIHFERLILYIFYMFLYKKKENEKKKSCSYPT